MGVGSRGSATTWGGLLDAQPTRGPSQRPWSHAGTEDPCGAASAGKRAQAGMGARVSRALGSEGARGPRPPGARCTRSCWMSCMRSSSARVSRRYSSPAARPDM